MKQKIDLTEENDKDTYKGFGKLASSMFGFMIAAFGYFIWTSTRKSKQISDSVDDSVSGMVEAK